MAQQNAKAFKILLPKIGQRLPVDTVVGERLRVLAEANAVKPLPDIFGHPAASTRSRYPAKVYDWRAILSIETE